MKMETAAPETAVWEAFESALAARLNLTRWDVPEVVKAQDPDEAARWLAILLSDGKVAPNTGALAWGDEALYFEIPLSEQERNVVALRACRDAIMDALLKTREGLTAAYPEKERYFPTHLLQIPGGEYMWLYYLDNCADWADISCEIAEAVYIEGIGHSMFLQGVPLSVKDPRLDDWDLSGRLLLWDDKRNVHAHLADFAVRADGPTMERQLDEPLFGPIAEPNFAKIRPEWTEQIRLRYDVQTLRLSDFATRKREGRLCSTLGGFVRWAAIRDLLL